MKKSLRVIIATNSTLTKNKIIQSTLAHFPVSHCTIVSTLEWSFTIRNCKDVQWLNYFELLYGRYPMQWNENIALDEPLLRKLAYCETLTLQMMNRFDWDETISYNQRKEMYLNHVRFWNDQLLSKKINLFIFFGVPHEIFDFVLYSLCKIHSIPVICLENGRHRDTTIIFRDYEQSMVELGKRYTQLLSGSPTPSETFMRKITNISFQTDVSPSAIWKHRMYGLTGYVKALATAVTDKPMTIIGRLINPLFWLHRIQSIMKKKLLELYYWKLSQNPDMTKKFIYVALHYQPECTTSPLAGVFVNQELIVYMLHQVLPKNVRIYVKEHPMPSYTMRSFSYYKSLLISPRITLVRKNVSSQQLIKNSLAVATATGTAGWEALTMGKPVCMFGKDFYQFARGVFRIDSIQSCRQAIDKIVRKKYTPSLRELNAFYKAMEDTLIDGYIDEYYQPYSHLSNKQNVLNVTTALIREIKKDVPYAS